MGKRTRKKKSISLTQIRGLTPLVLGDRDGPTPERLAKLPGVAIVQRRGGTRIVAMAPDARHPVGADGICRVSQAPLDRLAAQGRLDADLEAALKSKDVKKQDWYRNNKCFEAGDLLRTHWYLAGLEGGPGSIDLQRSGGGNGHPAWLTPSSESAAWHRQRFRAAREGMEAGHWRVTFAVCCGEETLEAAGREAGVGNRDGANAVALDRLRLSLRLLAIWWGLLPPRPCNDDAKQLDKATRAPAQVVEGDEVGAIIDRMVIANAVAQMKKAG